jgi:hypothetical protein
MKLLVHADLLFDVPELQEGDYPQNAGHIDVAREIMVMQKILKESTQIKIGDSNTKLIGYPDIEDNIEVYNLKS